MKTLELMKEIETELAEFDAKLLIKEKQWAVDRVAAVKAVRENQPRHMDAFKRYAELYTAAGGKTWYSIFNGRSVSMIEEFVTKNNKATADKRNAKIAKKLNEAGILQITSGGVKRENGGFNGVYCVVTDKGPKTITIDTILAGGYNIQCAHLRVLVNVK